ncbi:MAG: LamG domain protein jellyroll fold domain protein [Myxococcales bacterium]|nr:LamG domain protein jellyroll fold domain protein [Myxococcales bacterium]
MRWIAGIFVIASCGRFDFDVVSDAGVRLDAGVPDAGTGMLLHFAFESDGLLHDRAAGHDATCTECPIQAAGRVGVGAASFDGTQCLHVADAPDLRPSSFTFAVWVLLPMIQSSSPFARPYQGATSSVNTFEVFDDLVSRYGIGVGTTSVKGPLTAGVWHHLAGTYDATSLVTFVDGSAGTPQPVGQVVSYAADDILIGCDEDTGVLFNKVKGLIDDVRLYDHALTPGEVAALASM